MKYGRCTNRECDNYDEEIELQDWWPDTCQRCKSALKIGTPPKKSGLAHYLIPATILTALLLIGFAVTRWIDGNATQDNSELEQVEEQRGISPLAKPGISEAAELPADPFSELESFLKLVASPSSTERQADQYVDKVLSMCASPGIEVRFVSNQGTVTERITISDFLDQLRLLQEDNFKVSKVFPTSAGDKIATIEIQETNIG